MGKPQQIDESKTVSRLVLVVSLAIVLTSPSVLFAQGELSSLRTAVRDDSSPPAEPQKASKGKKAKKQKHNAFCQCHRCCDDDDDDDSFNTLVGWAIGGVITAPWWGPVVMLEDDYNIEGYFSDNPYKGRVDGYMMIHPWLPEEPRTMSARASMEYMTSFDDLSNVNSKFLIDTASRWGLDSAITYRSEELGMGVNDSLLTGDVNLFFRFAQSPHAQFRTGIGMNWLSDDVDEDFGFNFTYAFDLYPAKPWIISTELDWGRLGNAHLFHLRSTAGMAIHAGEVYIGVDYYDVGPMDMTTMVTGVRVWF